MLDSAIAVVVSGVNLNRLDGLGLLERVRDSKLARIRSLPFFWWFPARLARTIANSPASAARLILFQRFQQCLAGACTVHSGAAARRDVESAEASHHYPVPMPRLWPEEDIGTRTDVGVRRYSWANGWRQGLQNHGLVMLAMTVWPENPVGDRKNWMSAWPVF